MEPKCAKGSQKRAKRAPKGAKGSQKGAKTEPKGAKREPKGRPKGAQGEAKSIKTQGFFWHGFREANKAIRDLSGRHFKVDFGSMLAAKIVDFSCYFLASFFDGFLEASGCILGSMLVDFWRSFLVFSRLCGKSRTPRIYCK